MRASARNTRVGPNLSASELSCLPISGDARGVRGDALTELDALGEGDVREKTR
jgi:hypothetical protein